MLYGVGLERCRPSCRGIMWTIKVKIRREQDPVLTQARWTTSETKLQKGVTICWKVYYRLGECFQLNRRQTQREEGISNYKNVKNVEEKKWLGKGHHKRDCPPLQKLSQIAKNTN